LKFTGEKDIVPLEPNTPFTLKRKKFISFPKDIEENKDKTTKQQHKILN